jgi:uncharacterized phage protein (TIGR02220 family)
MAKELPYFKFEPAEYLTKDISFCSLSAQGLFINICSYYWQRNCQITKEQLLKRLNYPEEFQELINEGVIDLNEKNYIIIKFLDNQLTSVEEKSKINSANGSKGGRPKKIIEINLIESEIKPKLNPIESETKGIREDKIKEYKEKDNNLSVNWDGLLSQFNSITGKKMRVVCPKTKKQVTARLKEGYSKQDLVNAITNCFNDDFHKDNPHFLTLEFISRSEKMQKYSQDIKKAKPKQQDRL